MAVPLVAQELAADQAVRVGRVGDQERHAGSRQDTPFTTSLTVEWCTPSSRAISAIDLPCRWLSRTQRTASGVRRAFGLRAPWRVADCFTSVPAQTIQQQAV